MSNLNELYQEVILDHNKSPRNYRKIDNPDFEADGYNPLCGDHVHVYFKLNGDIIEDVSFQGAGCAISKSSASLMTTMLKGKTVKEAEELFNKFHETVTSSIEDEVDLEELGKLAVFSGVREFPTRVKCASLSWHTAMNAIKGEKEKTTTE